jgi:hypothetical protein
MCYEEPIMRILHSPLGLSLLSTIHCALAGEISATQFKHAETAPIPPEVANSPILLETKHQLKGSLAGNRLVIQKIAPPVFPAREVATAQREEGAQLPARPKKIAVKEYRVFSPTVTIFPNGLSHVAWGVLEAPGNWQNYEAWVAVDLSTVEACGDIADGDVQYFLSPSVLPAGLKYAARLSPPKAGELGGDFLLIKGDASKSKAMSPLLTLLAVYKQDAAKIKADFDSRQAEQAARAAWLRENPEPARDTVLKFWEIDAKSLTKE